METVKKNSGTGNVKNAWSDLKVILQEQLPQLIKESVKRVLRESMMDRCFIADEGDGNYNIFSYDDFDDEGYYMGHEGEEGYHIDDFDIVAEFDSFEEAEEYLENELEF